MELEGFAEIESFGFVVRVGYFKMERLDAELSGFARGEVESGCAYAFVAVWGGDEKFVDESVAAEFQAVAEGEHQVAFTFVNQPDAAQTAVHEHFGQTFSAEGFVECRSGSVPEASHHFDEVFGVVERCFGEFGHGRVTRVRYSARNVSSGFSVRPVWTGET